VISILAQHAESVWVLAIGIVVTIAVGYLFSIRPASFGYLFLTEEK
jgi:hypothetical protein